VMNNDFASPLRLAQEASTVDLLTDGRLELGLGSGWAKREYDLLGVAYNPARRRAERLQNAVTVMKSAWSGGQVLSAADGSIPAVPPPTQSPHPPLLIGGQGDSILAAAAREADIVGFTGYTWNGSTLAPTGLSSETLTDRIRFVRDAAGSRFQNLELNVLLRAVRTSSRRRDGKESVAKELGIPTSDVAASPFVLAGTVDDVVEKLLGVRECLGVSYFVAFQTELDELTPVIDALAGR
jgi:probable F420-dependent oxidoreductase